MTITDEETQVRGAGQPAQACKRWAELGFLIIDSSCAISSDDGTTCRAAGYEYYIDASLQGRISVLLCQYAATLLVICGGRGASPVRIVHKRGLHAIVDIKLQENLRRHTCAQLCSRSSS